jgi:hypothetical protein
LASNKAVQQKWRSIAEEAPTVNEQLTDGMESLRKLFTKYLAKAQYLQRLSFKQSKLTPSLVLAISYYLEAARNVRELLPEASVATV